MDRANLPTTGELRALATSLAQALGQEYLPSDYTGDACDPVTWRYDDGRLVIYASEYWIDIDWYVNGYPRRVFSAGGFRGIFEQRHGWDWLDWLRLLNITSLVKFWEAGLP